MIDQVNSQHIERCLLEVVGAEHVELRESIQQRAEVIELRSGQVIFEQGEPGHSMYLVVRGRLRATVSSTGQIAAPIVEVGRNEAMGEIALFTSHMRTATVTAARDSLVLRLDRDDFEELSEKWPGFALQLCKRVVDRLSRSMLGLASETTKATILTVVATHDGVDIDAFTARMSAALAEHGSILSLDERNIIRKLSDVGITEPMDQAAHRNMAAWMDDQEAKYGFVICKASTSASQWTRRCIRLSDKVILVGDTSTSRQADSLNQKTIREAGVDCEFVLLHQDRNRAATGTPEILSTRRLTRHHHVVTTSTSDFQRLARFLAGKATGIVLAGGGARGFAHIGVVRALREANIPIDYVGGTSIGSIIGALVAMDLDIKSIETISKQGFLDDKPLNDYTIPTIALLKGKKLDRLIQTYFTTETIEDLWLNFFCVSANLTTDETVVHDTGTLWQSLRASIALPGVLPPVIRNGELLVDGGMVNNLPVDIMRTKGVGSVIAVDLRGGSRQFSVSADAFESPASALRRRWFGDSATPQNSDSPGIFDILMRASLIGSAQQTSRNMATADLYLNPPMEQIGLLEFKAFDQIVQAGYEHTVKTLADLNSPSPEGDAIGLRTPGANV